MSIDVNLYDVNITVQSPDSPAVRYTVGCTLRSAPPSRSPIASRQLSWAQSTDPSSLACRSRYADRGTWLFCANIISYKRHVKRRDPQRIRRSGFVWCAIFTISHRTSRDRFSLIIITLANWFRCHAAGVKRPFARSSVAGGVVWYARCRFFVCSVEHPKKLSCARQFVSIFLNRRSAFDFNHARRLSAFSRRSSALRWKNKNEPLGRVERRRLYSYQPK